jgi:hypothetical protein
MSANTVKWPGYAKTTCRPYLRILFGLVLGSLIPLALFNLAIDPYALFGINRMGVYISADREAKVTLAQRYPDHGLLMGNSKTGFIPANTLDGPPLINVALGAAQVYEMADFVERFGQNRPLIVVGLAHGQPASDPHPGTAFPPLDTTRALEYLFNLRSLEYSGKTLLQYLTGRPPILQEDGSLHLGRWENALARDLGQEPELDLEASRRVLEDVPPPNDENMAAYHRLKAALEASGSPFLVFIHPTHEQLLMLMRSGSNASAFDQRQQQIQQLFPDAVDFTDSIYCLQDFFFPTDPVHYLPSTGTTFLNNHIFGDQPVPRIKPH